MKNYKKDNGFTKSHERQDAFLLEAEGAKQDLLMIEAIKAGGQKTSKCPVCHTQHFPVAGEEYTVEYSQACGFCTDYITERARRFDLALRSRRSDRWEIVGQTYLYPVDAEKVNRAKSNYLTKWFNTWRFLPASEIALLYINKTYIGGEMLSGRDIQTLPEHIRAEVWNLIDTNKHELKVAASRPMSSNAEGFKIESDVLDKMDKACKKKETAVLNMTLGKKQLPAIVKEYCGMTEQQKRETFDAKNESHPALFQ